MAIRVGGVYHALSTARLLRRCSPLGLPVRPRPLEHIPLTPQLPSTDPPHAQLKAAPTSGQRPSWSGLLIALAVLGLYGLGALSSGTWLWGFDALAYGPLQVWGLVLVAAVAVLVAETRLGFLDALGVRAEGAPGFLRIGVPVLLGVLAGTAFLLFPIRTTAFGDARHMASWYGDNSVFDPQWLLEVLNPHVLRSKEALTVGVHRTLAHVAGASIDRTYQVVSALSGAALLTCFLLWVWREPALRRHLPLLAVAGLTLSGNQLFFGQVENYPFAVLGSAVFLMAAFRFFSGATPVWLFLLLWLVAARAHAVNGAFAPAVLYALAWRFRERIPGVSLRLGWRWAAAGLMLPGLLGGAVLYFFVFGSHDEAYFAVGRQIEASFLPLVSQNPPLRNYTLYSPAHAVDFLNVLVLIGAPVVVLGLIWIGEHRGRIEWSHPRMVFFGLSLLFMGLFFFALNPALTMPRDWDLYGLLLAPILIGFATLLAHSAGTGRRSATGPAVLALGLVSAWGFGINAGTDRLSHRLEAWGEHAYRTYYAGSSFLITVGQKMETDWARQLARREGSLSRLTPWEDSEDFEYAFLLSGAGATHSRVGDNLTAAERFEEALVRTAHLASLRMELAALYLHEGLPEKALPHLLVITDSQPSNMRTLVMAATAAIQVGDAERARRFLAQGARVAPDHEGLKALGRLAREQGLLLEEP